MFWCFGKSKKFLATKGFSLLELMVVITIFSIMTAVVITDIPNFRDKNALDLTASEVATYIRGAQVYGAAQKGGASGVTIYIIKFIKDSSDFALYKNVVGTIEESYQIKGFKIGSILVNDSSPCSISNNVSISFKVNDYSIGIGTQLEPQVKVDDTIECTDFSSVKIEIASIKDGVESRCVYVYNNGQIVPASCS